MYIPAVVVVRLVELSGVDRTVVIISILLLAVDVPIDDFISVHISLLIAIASCQHFSHTDIPVVVVIGLTTVGWTVMGTSLFEFLL